MFEDLPVQLEDPCPCCEADMRGSDHCPECFCEAHQTINPDHLRQHVRDLQRRLAVVRSAVVD